MMNQKCCTTCDRVDVNEMTDERYCSLKDYAQIKLRWHKYRPDWCPLEDAEEVYMKHYKQGRLDEAAEREGRLMQAFSPD